MGRGARMRDRQSWLGNLGSEKRERLEGLRHATRRARVFGALQCRIDIRYPVPVAVGGRSSRTSWPLPPARTLSRQAGQPVCRQEPSRVGMDELPVAAIAPCSHAPGRQAPAQPSPGATAGTPRASCVTRTDQPRLPILFRSVSSPALFRAPPSAAGARIHLGGLCLASRLPSTTAGTQLVSSVQSACSPQLQPVENLKKSQVSRLPGRWQVHAF